MFLFCLLLVEDGIMQELYCQREVTNYLNMFIRQTYQMFSADYRGQQTNLDAGGGERGEQSKHCLLYDLPTIGLVSHISCVSALIVRRDLDSYSQRNRCVRGNVHKCGSTFFVDCYSVRILFSGMTNVGPTAWNQLHFLSIFNSYELCV